MLSNGSSHNTSNDARYVGTYGDTAYPTYLFTVPRTVIWDVLDMDSPGNTWLPCFQPTSFLGEERPPLALGQVDLEYSASHPFQSPKLKSARGCTLRPCVQEYSIKVEAGIVKANLTNTRQGAYTTLPSDLMNLTTPRESFSSEVWAPDYMLTETQDPNFCHTTAGHPEVHKWCNTCNFGTGNLTCVVDDRTFLPFEAAYTLTAPIISMMTGNATWYIDYYGEPEWFTNLSSVAYPGTARNITNLTIEVSSTEYSSAVVQHILTERGLEKTLSDIADSLTALMQQDGDTVITGQAGQAEAYVYVRWPWMIYPIVVILLGLIFVLVVIVQTSRDDRRLWKSSSLALLYHGLNRLDEDTRARAVDLEAMEELAKRTRVRLEGWALEERRPEDGLRA